MIQAANFAAKNDVQRPPEPRMARFCGHCSALHRVGNEEAAARAKVFIAREFHRCHWPHAPWRGANLGGWFLLEPGPASPLFDSVKQLSGSEVGGIESGTEWDLCAALDSLDERPAEARGEEAADGAAAATVKARVLDEHRAKHYTSETMARIKAAGLNAVRIPFGYWIITGATQGDRYHGPCLDLLDKAVDMAATAGLQVVLDLHGCPGGENGLRPCGRAKAGWAYQEWRVEESLQVLRLVALRYKDSSAVTGIQVCNEPSPAIPAAKLCEYYEKAIQVLLTYRRPALLTYRRPTLHPSRPLYHLFPNPPAPSASA